MWKYTLENRFYRAVKKTGLNNFESSRACVYILTQTLDMFSFSRQGHHNRFIPLTGSIIDNLWSIVSPQYVFINLHTRYPCWCLCKPVYCLFYGHAIQTNDNFADRNERVTLTLTNCLSRFKWLNIFSLVMLNSLNINQ